MLKNKLVLKGLNYNITVQTDETGFEIIKKTKENEIWNILGSTLASFRNDGIVVISSYSISLSQRFFLIFLRERDQEQAAKRRQRVAKATRRERKTSGYLGLESHFHADDRVRI